MTTKQNIPNSKPSKLYKVLNIYSWEREKGFLLLTQYQVVSYVQKVQWLNGGRGAKLKNRHFFPTDLHFEATWNTSNGCTDLDWAVSFPLPSYIQKLSQLPFTQLSHQTLSQKPHPHSPRLWKLLVPQSLAHPHAFFPLWDLCFPRVSQLYLLPNPFMSVILTEYR